MMKKLLLSSMLLAFLVPFAGAHEHQVEVISDGHQFTEGPLWHDNALWFSDIPASTVYRWTPETGVEIALKPSSGANGLITDSEGNLLMAQHQARRIARLNADGTQTALATEYQGKRLNSPNDLALADTGVLYFTDPPFAVSEEEQELDFSGVFALSPAGELNGDYKQGMDGMAVAKDGTLYVAGPEGIYVYSPAGELLETIELPDFTANVTLVEGKVETDKRVLYVTSQTEVIKITLHQAN